MRLGLAAAVAAMALGASSARATEKVSWDGMSVERVLNAARTQTLSQTSPMPARRSERPTPIAPSFKVLLPVWKEGTVPSEEQLLGSWKMVVQTPRRPTCAFLGEDLVNEGGLSDLSGQVVKLSFDRRKVPGIPGEVLSVSLMSGDQLADGPFRVKLTEPQFSLWAWPAGSWMHTHAHWNMNCRLIKGNANQLICAEKVRLGRGHNWDPKTLACSKFDHSMIEVYQK
ncbi:MAG: hypothetical protein HY078_13885 [Elusimicrobia bacterium]|nr:hypothetical protein [Elusimicrobiota bacterium]